MTKNKSNENNDGDEIKIAEIQKRFLRLLMKPQWQRMPVDHILKLAALLGLSEGEARGEYGSIWSLTADQVKESELNAKIIRAGYEDDKRGDWGNRISKALDIAYKTQGIIILSHRCLCFVC